MSAPSPISAAGLMQNPRLYPLQVDWAGGRVWLLHTDAGWYDQAAFLDQRALGSAPKGTWVPLQDLKAAVATVPDKPCGLIFHVGHCGSTLISRALGLIPGLFSLREPLPFRDMAAKMAQTGTLPAALGTFRRLWARTETPDALAIIKATSFCSLMAANWLDAWQTDRAVMLAMAPETYITTLLGAPAYIADLKGGAPMRRAALERATGATLAPLESLSPGELAAMSFMAEIVNLHLGAEAGGGRALRLDFDAYLRDPAASLIQITAHFGRSLTGPDAARILAHPLLGRYSKATDYRFTAQDRRDRLAESRAANRAEIERGLIWTRDFAREHSPARDALIAWAYAR